MVCQAQLSGVHFILETDLALLEGWKAGQGGKFQPSNLPTFQITENHPG